MEVILLKTISKLGLFGEKVKVKAGYGRNSLVPLGLALQLQAKKKVYVQDRNKLMLLANASEKGKLHDAIEDRVRYVGDYDIVFPEVLVCLNVIPR